MLREAVPLQRRETPPPPFEVAQSRIPSPELKRPEDPGIVLMRDAFEAAANPSYDTGRLLSEKNALNHLEPVALVREKLDAVLTSKEPGLVEFVGAVRGVIADRARELGVGKTKEEREEKIKGMIVDSVGGLAATLLGPLRKGEGVIGGISYDEYISSVAKATWKKVADLGGIKLKRDARIAALAAEREKLRAQTHRGAGGLRAAA